MEAGERLFAFNRLPPSQWRSGRTTNAIERLHEEFKRRIKTQTVLPSADTAAMLFWALLASGQINTLLVHRVEVGIHEKHGDIAAGIGSRSIAPQSSASAAGLRLKS